MPRSINAARMIGILGTKALIIPKEGWTAHTFRLHGLPMILTLARVAKITERRQTALVARAVAAAFRKQIDEVLRRFSRTSLFGRSGATASDTKAFTGDIFLPAHEALIHEILGDVLRETGAQVTAEITPAVQSTLAQGYSKTSILLGQDPLIGASNMGLQRRAKELASRITGLSDTTRTRMRTLLGKAVEQRWSIPQTARAISEQIPKIQAHRALLIAQTETNRSFKEGAIQAFKESKTITTITVVSCTNREPERWGDPSYQQYLWRGESTCLAQDIPVPEVDGLNWHPGCGGVLVPSGFTD